MVDTLDGGACQTVTTLAMAADAPPESPFDRRRHPAALTLAPWIAPDGWRHRAYRWAQAGDVRPRGSLIFQTGRADFIEKYLETCDHFHRAGWLVEGFDWRGQGGSGRLGVDPHVDDRAEFETLVDDLAAYVAAWRVRTPGPHVAIAHSMGGYVLLTMLATRGIALDAVVLVAPMLALNAGWLPTPAARLIARIVAASPRGRQPAWRDRRIEPQRQLRLTADKARYDDSRWWKTVDPSLELGPPSWRWIDAAFAAGARVARMPLARVRTPMLLLVPGRDGLVRRGGADRVAARLPDAVIRHFPAARHELLREADVERDAALAAIDAFLAARAPVAPA